MRKQYHWGHRKLLVLYFIISIYCSTKPVGEPINASSGLRAFRVVTQQSNASYEAHFLVAGQTVPGTVTGITGDVSGEFLLTADDRPIITSMRVIVDLRTLDSGASERDDHVRSDTLEVNKYPYAIFSVMNARVLPGRYNEGQMVSFTLKGNLTLHGVTRPATFDMQGELTNNMVMGSATRPRQHHCLLTTCPGCSMMQDRERIFHIKDETRHRSP